MLTKQTSNPYITNTPGVNLYMGGNAIDVQGGNISDNGTVVYAAGNFYGNATNATNDGNGNNIVNTYATQTGYYGSMSVGNADSATNATNDANGNNIANTYATQNNVVNTYAATTGTYAGMTVGNATNATNDANGNNIASTYATPSGIAAAGYITNSPGVDLYMGGYEIHNVSSMVMANGETIGYGTLLDNNSQTAIDWDNRLLKSLNNSTPYPTVIDFSGTQNAHAGLSFDSGFNAYFYDTANATLISVDDVGSYAAFSGTGGVRVWDSANGYATWQSASSIDAFSCDSSGNTIAGSGLYLNYYSGQVVYINGDGTTAGITLDADGGTTTFPTAVTIASGALLRAKGGLQINGHCALSSGTGAPTATATPGDIYFRTGTPTTANQRIYVYTTSGWVGII